MKHQTAVCYDLAAQLSNPKSRDILRQELRPLAEMGLKRIYVVTTVPGYPMFSHQHLAPVQYEGYHLVHSVAALENAPNRVFAEVCHELGLEVIAVYKPYENGGGMSVPEGYVMPEGCAQFPAIGGTRVFHDDFTAQHPDLRIRRRNDLNPADNALSVDRIELIFDMDAVTMPMRATVQDFGCSKATRHPELTLWVSDDNGTYMPYAGEFSVTYQAADCQIADPNGRVLFARAHRCLKATITGVEIRSKYLAVTVTDAAEHRLLPYSMLNIYCGDKKLPSTVSPWIRVLHPNAPEGEWHAQLLPINGSDKNWATFSRRGFEFGWYGTGHRGDGWETSNVYGIARGQAEYLPGSLCEAYPEVRAYWLDMVRKLLDDGFDGVDIRLQNHSGMIPDPINYGFNEPVVEACRGDLSPVNMMKVRGGFFMLFLEEAQKEAHARGKSFHIHLKHAHEHPEVNPRWNMLSHWTMPKIALDWRKCIDLADEITIKDYYYKTYRTDLASGIKTYAYLKGKPCWVHMYYQQGDRFDEAYMASVRQDDRIAGMQVYEFANEEVFYRGVKDMLDADK